MPYEFSHWNGFRIGKADSTLFTKKRVKIYLYTKYTLMILSLVLLTNPFVMSLARSWPIGLKCPWWGFSHSFLDFKSSKSRNGLSLAKQSTHMIYSRSLAWIKQRPSRLPWALMNILIFIWAAHRLIKRYITPWLDLYFTFVHLVPISC
jgi:hypothetical protein